METQVPTDPKQEQAQQPKPPELEILTGLFESTVTFFRLINKTMISLGYSRQKRRQVWDSLIHKSTVSDKDIIAALMAELKPILDEAKAKTEAAQQG